MNNAFELDLWSTHKTRLRDCIARRVGSRDTVDDLLQETFLKAYTARHTVKSPGSAAAWLYRIAANAIADHYRRQRPTEEVSDDLAAPVPEQDWTGELASCVKPMIASLPEAYRTPLILSDIDGLPQSVVGTRLGLSLSGAKSRVQRGREKLRRHFDECCDVEMDGGRIVGYKVRDKQRDCARL